MSRKDFIAIAHALGLALDQQGIKPEQIQAIATDFGNLISHTNASFKLDVFVKAVVSAAVNG